MCTDTLQKEDPKRLTETTELQTDQLHKEILNISMSLVAKLPIVLKSFLLFQLQLTFNIILVSSVQRVYPTK